MLGEYDTVGRYLMGDDLDASGRKVLVDITAHPDIEGERLLKVRHHGVRPGRSPDLEWYRALPTSPASEEQVGELEHVVRVQVREEHSRDGAYRHTGLRESQRCPAAAVEQKALTARFDQRARSILLQIHGRPGGRTK